MKTSFSSLSVASFVIVLLASFVAADVCEAAVGGGRGGGGGGGGARAAAADRGGAARAAPDARANNVRSTSVNNVNVSQNVNVNVSGGGCSGRCGGWDHPVAAAAVVTGTVMAIGAIVTAPPPGCVPVNYSGMVYQQCGGTWYAPQGSQFVVVNPPY